MVHETPEASANAAMEKARQATDPVEYKAGDKVMAEGGIHEAQPTQADNAAAEEKAMELAVAAATASMGPDEMMAKIKEMTAQQKKLGVAIAVWKKRFIALVRSL